MEFENGVVIGAGQKLEKMLIYRGFPKQPSLGLTKIIQIQGNIQQVAVLLVKMPY